MQKIVLTFAANVMNALVGVTGGHVLAALVLLALFVELALLYPSVRLQLKQKKIHLFHKKLVDRFRVGELSYSQTESELGKLYAVNEKIHSRGAVLVILQVLLFLAVLWGLNLLTQSPGLFHGAWTVLNFDLLQKATAPLLPVLVSLLYFLHALTKIVCKEKADYISPTQTMMALLFAVLGSTVIYFFAGTFAGALSVFCAAIFAFSTVRYLIVEGHAQTWGELAQHDLIEMLRHAETSHDRFETFSQAWNHLPMVRYINFHLLEEALSMSLGLMLALNFFGVFSAPDHDLSANLLDVPRAMADFPAATVRVCDSSAPNPPICSNGGSPAFLTDRLHPNSWNKIVNFSDAAAGAPQGGIVNFSSYAFNSADYPIDALPTSCCLSQATASGLVSFQALKPQTVLPSNASNLILVVNGSPACVNLYSVTCPLITDPAVCRSTPACHFDSGVCGGTTTTYISSCSYQFTSIPHVQIATGCPASDVTIGTSLNFSATGGSRYFKWKVRSGSASGAVLGQNGDGTSNADTFSSVISTPGAYSVYAEDYYNPLNNTDTAEGTSATSSCTLHVVPPPITLMAIDQPAIQWAGAPAQLHYRIALPPGPGPGAPYPVIWQLVSGPGTLDPATGLYTPSSAAADTGASIVVKAVDQTYPTNMSAPLTLAYVPPVCNSQFGLYDLHGTALAGIGGRRSDKNVYTSGTYRFFVKHAVIPGADGFIHSGIDNGGDGVGTRTFGVLDDGTPYIDIAFAQQDDFGFGVWDAAVPPRSSTSACQANLHFIINNSGIHLNSPKHVNVGF